MKKIRKVSRMIMMLTTITVVFVGCARSEEGASSDTSMGKSDEISVQVSGTNIEADMESFETTTPVKTEKNSLLGFLKTAIEPVGSTMYVWGGGWNEEDTAAGVEAVTLGISPKWAEFAAEQDSSYDYNTTKYQIHDGLDCSGYVGWAVYNVLETENGKEGYVLSSTEMANNYAQRGLGEYIPVESMTKWQAGDIMSMSGHVWIVVGMCDDGSVLMLHSSPPGVSFCGTRLADGSKSQAVILAEKVMSEHYPDWYAKYPDCARAYSYLTTSSAMRWSRNALSDDEGLSGMTAEKIVEVIFK